jgi:hypothetical protein
MSAQSISVNEFIDEAMELAIRLDAVSTRDDRRAITQTLIGANAEYEDLVERRSNMPVLLGETAVLDGLLDSLRARLKFLEKCL